MGERWTKYKIHRSRVEKTVLWRTYFVQQEMRHTHIQSMQSIYPIIIINLVLIPFIFSLSLAHQPMCPIVHCPWPDLKWFENRKWWRRAKSRGAACHDSLKTKRLFACLSGLSHRIVCFCYVCICSSGDEWSNAYSIMFIFYLSRIDAMQNILQLYGRRFLSAIQSSSIPYVCLMKVNNCMFNSYT